MAEIASDHSRFHLRHRDSRATDLKMKLLNVAALTALVLLPSCGEDNEVVVTETRRVTLRDVTPKRNASSDERFRNTQPSPVTAPTPDGWNLLPATEFRLLNYRFGDEGNGEVYVSLSRGGLLDNLNRWLGQFDQDPINETALEEWNTIPVGDDLEGFWVEAQGIYTPGMGKPAVSDQALAGIIVDANGRVLTIKMVGPITEVAVQKDVLKQFAASLVWTKK